MGSLDDSTCSEEIRDEGKDSIRTKFKAESTVNNAQNGGNDNSKKKRAAGLPLEVGIRLLCKWRDSKLHPVKIIERRKLPNGFPQDYEYYVHYTEFNRRLDEWVKLEQFELDSVETDADEKIEDKGGSLKMTRHQKRKIDEIHVEEVCSISILRVRVMRILILLAFESTKSLRKLRT